MCVQENHPSTQPFLHSRFSALLLITEIGCSEKPYEIFRMADVRQD